MGAKSRIWARLVTAGRKTQAEMESGVGAPNAFIGMTASEVVRSLSYRPKKDELQQACDWLQIRYDGTETNNQLKALIYAAAGIEEPEEAE